jgi:diacylglycerol O-acyltransferase-1
MKMDTRTSSVVESTGFEGIEGLRDKPDNGVTRRLRIDDPHTAQDTTTTPSDTPANGFSNGFTDGSADGPVDVSELRKAFRQKYRHVQAIHSQSKPSCLSHDTTETPSFLGFRNLMVIVLGGFRCVCDCTLTTALTPMTVAANLRLVIENIQKVGFLSLAG